MGFTVEPHIVFIIDLPLLGHRPIWCLSAMERQILPALITVQALNERIHILGAHPVHRQSPNCVEDLSIA
ncbi:hypothetical protein A6R71_06175 [Xanthomonas translucens pv. arrhenatheri]|nr:hypothetical protein A6R71_06175 [Xanthomonas translucens pv. arrhenatheri]